MNRIVSTTVFTLSLVASGVALSAAAGPATADEAGIKAVMDQFQVALKAKDEAAIGGLFTGKDAPVIASAGERTFQFVRSKKADAPKVLDSTAGKFAAEVARDKTSAEERFSNVRIDSDGAVASVAFDFVYLSDGKPANVGKEAWLLVKGEHGWRISSIVYSMNFPDKT